MTNGDYLLLLLHCTYYNYLGQRITNVAALFY